MNTERTFERIGVVGSKNEGPLNESEIQMDDRVTTQELERFGEVETKKEVFDFGNRHVLNPKIVSPGVVAAFKQILYMHRKHPNIPNKVKMFLWTKFKEEVKKVDPCFASNSNQGNIFNEILIDTQSNERYGERVITQTMEIQIG